GQASRLPGPARRRPALTSPDDCPEGLRRAGALRFSRRPPSRSSADPLLAAFVELLLPERYPGLEGLDHVHAHHKCILAIQRGDRDRDARPADLDPAGAM